MRYIHQKYISNVKSYKLATIMYDPGNTRLNEIMSLSSCDCIHRKGSEEADIVRKQAGDCQGLGVGRNGSDRVI